MWNASALALEIEAVERTARGRGTRALVAEPPFRPFWLPRRSAALGLSGAASELHTDGTRASRTLEELGVPSHLAAEFESALRAIGLVQGDRIVGLTFRTPDGVALPLRTGAAGAVE
jgi:hypothetical protein